MGGDVDQVRPRIARALQRTHIFLGEAERNVPAVELAEIVEADLGLRRRHRIIAAEVAQDAVADAAVGHRAQLLLHALERAAGIGRRADVEHNRIQAGEPAHRARHVHIRQQRLAAMAFEIDQQRPLPAPVGNRLGQRRQQRIVDLGVVDARHLLQQRRGLRRTERARHRAHRTRAVRPPGMVERQPGSLRPRQRLPIAQLAPCCRRSGIGHQLFGPALVRGGLGRQLHRRAALQCLERDSEVLQQDPPRHPVDHQVMNDQEQPLARSTEIEQGRAQQRPFGKIKASLQPLGMPGQGRSLRCAGKLRQIDRLARDPAPVLIWRMHLLPAGLTATKP